MAFGSRFSGDGAGRFTMPVIANLVWRLIQIILAIVVIAFYATDLNSGIKPIYYVHSRFAFALVVGILAAITAALLAVASIFLAIPALAYAFAWEWVLTILWAAVAGLFASTYLHGIDARQRIAAGFDLANLIAWGVSAIAGTALFFTRGRRSLHTGRATV